jgi:hypothetical protein
MRKVLAIAAMGSFAVLIAALWARSPRSGPSAPARLVVTYGEKGVEKLTYDGRVLEDVTQSPEDTFHIWHMKCTDLHGAPLTQGQYGWGETNAGRSWDGSSKTWTYNFVWGTIRAQFAQNADNLDVKVTVVNHPGSGVTFDGAVIYPFALHFPQLPAAFGTAEYPQLAFTSVAPGVVLADYGSGETAAVVPDASRPLYAGFWPTGRGTGYSAMVSGTAPDGLATFQPHFDRPVAPGKTDSYVLSIRFAPAGAPLRTLAADAYEQWARSWPQQLHWSDRRAIGTVYLASSPAGDRERPGGYANNPRRYFNNSNAGDFDIRSQAGLAAFQRRILAQAAANLLNLRRLHAQGAITWDIEGEEYPQSTSYVCAPDEIASIAPEMESVVAERGSPYFGMKLDDAYFKTMTSAGFRVGVCVRPQHFTQEPGGGAKQVDLQPAAIADELIRKMRFAHDRWGATIFYVDSTVEANGAVLDAGIFEKVAAAFPDSLVIPEESTPKYFAYTAPFLSFIYHGDTGTDASVYNYYPHAFSVNLVNDADAGKLMAARSSLEEAVRRGDILMGHVDYWQSNNPAIVAIYQAAAAHSAHPQ